MDAPKDGVGLGTGDMWNGRGKRFGRAALLGAAALGLTISAAAPVQAGTSTSGDVTAQVVGGAEVGIDQFPSMAALLVKWPGHPARERFFCTGTVIAPRKVLTAAHCAVLFYSVGPNRKYKGIEVQVGKRDLGNPLATVVTATSAVIDKHWFFDTISRDLAIVHLAEPVSVPVARLATTGEQSLATSGNVTVAGWGITQRVKLYDFWPEGTVPRRAHFVEMPVVADNECQSLYDDNIFEDFVVPATDICAGTVGKDACYGDSGGPLYAYDGGDLVQVGVTSRGAGCGTIFPGVFTDVGAMRTWIDGRLATPCRTPADDDRPKVKVFAC